MIHFDHSILHIFDFRSGTVVFSDQELTPEVHGFLEQHVEKCFQDPAAHETRLSADHPFWMQLEELQRNPESFIAVSKSLAERLHEQLSLAQEERGVDVAMALFRNEKSTYFGILEYVQQVGYTHFVANKEGQTKADIIQHFGILPSPAQRIGIYAFVDLNSKEVLFCDKKKIINGEVVYILPDRILECNVVVSQKETIKKVNAIVNKVAEEYGANPVQAVSKAKSYLLDNAKASDEFIPEKLGEKVFEGNPGMQKDFMEKVQKAKLPTSAPAEREYVTKTVSAHKIQTDTGIEISIPSTYLNDPDMIEFINETDGTISIAIKGIGKIENKG